MSKFTKDNFQQNQDDRRDRFAARSKKANNDSDTAYKASRSAVEHIPFGQPILVGHHSERGHRNAIAKAHRAMDKSVELSQKSRHYANKASAVGTGGIASDDPEAVIKLKEKLNNLVESQELMKAVNKAFRAGGFDKIEELELLKPNHLQALKDTMERVSYMKRPFESYSLSNNSANIRRIKNRIKELESIRSSDGIEIENDNFHLYIDDGRICIDFKGGKPNDQARTIVKRNGFKWSRYRAEWIRKVTANALASAKWAANELEQLEQMY